MYYYSWAGGTKREREGLRDEKEESGDIPSPHFLREDMGNLKREKDKGGRSGRVRRGKKGLKVCAVLTPVLLFLWVFTRGVALPKDPMSAEEIRWYKLMRDGDDLISKDNIVAITLALESYKEALKVAERTFGHKSMQTSESLRALALLCYKEENYEQGFVFYDRYVELGRYNKFSEGGLDLIYAILGVGRRVHRSGKYGDAEIIYEHSLNIAEKHFVNQDFREIRNSDEKRNLLGELIDVVELISASMIQLYGTVGDGEKARKSERRAGELITKIAGQKGIY